MWCWWKKELINSFIEEEKHENKDLDEEVDKVEKCDDAAVVIREYEEIIRIKQKNIIYIVWYPQIPEVQALRIHV